MFRKSKAKNAIIGVTLNASYIRLLELYAGSDRWYVNAFDQEVLPTQAMRGHSVVDGSLISESIQRMLSRSAFSTRKTVLGISDNLVLTDIISVPSDSSDVILEEQAFLAMNQMIEYPIDDLSLDFCRLDVSKDSSSQNLLIAATKTYHVNTRVLALKNAGLDVIKVDAERFAMHRAWIAFFLEDNHKTIAIVQLSQGLMRFFVMDKHQVLFFKEEMTFQHALMEKFGLQDDFFNQLKRMLNLFYANDEHHVIQEIMFFEEEVFLSQNLLEKELGISSKIADVCVRTLIKNSIEKGTYSSWMIEAGLALKGILHA